MILLIFIFVILSAETVIGVTELDDVDVIIIGRCSTVFEFCGVYVGYLDCCGVGTEEQFPIGESVDLFTNKGKFRDLRKNIIFMHNATGIFFWGQFVQYGRRYIPPLVLIYCHADKLWVY